MRYCDRCPPLLLPRAARAACSSFPTSLPAFFRLPGSSHKPQLRHWRQHFSLINRCRLPRPSHAMRRLANSATAGGHHLCPAWGSHPALSEPQRVVPVPPWGLGSYHPYRRFYPQVLVSYMYQWGLSLPILAARIEWHPELCRLPLPAFWTALQHRVAASCCNLRQALVSLLC